MSQRGADETLAEQLRHTLYGIERVSGTGKGATAPPCYYFRDSVFYRYRQLAGVVIDTVRGRQLCVNNHSNRMNELLRSTFSSVFGAAVLNPIQMESEGACLIADCDIDRKNTAAVLEYVSRKYQIGQAVHFNLDEHTAFGLLNPATRDV